MTLDLHDPSVRKKIDDRVRSGKYSSPEDVVAAALDSLERQERASEIGDFEPGELDELCQAGLDQFDRGEVLDAEEAFREIDALAARESGGAQWVAPK